jgi:chromosome segregation ATPase
MAAVTGLALRRYFIGIRRMAGKPALWGPYADSAGKKRLAHHTFAMVEVAEEIWRRRGTLEAALKGADPAALPMAIVEKNKEQLAAEVAAAAAAAQEALDAARSEKESAGRRNRDLKYELKLARDEASMRNKTAAQRMLEKLSSDLSGECDAIANDRENERRLKNNQAKRARAAEKTCGVQQALADNRYEKLQALEDKISDLQSQLDEVHEQLEVLLPIVSHSSHLASCLSYRSHTRQQ